MELKEFANSIADNSCYNIKVVLENLIGNGSSKDTWGTALANLYKSFPKEITSEEKNKKELSPIMVRYFLIYSLSKDNIEIFEDYASVFSAKDKDRIKDRNPNWVWEKEPEILFKNPLEFIKSIPRTSKAGPFNYIEKYEPQFANFVKNKKTKVIEHFWKKDIWKDMINRDYSKFSDFCEKYGFDKLETVKKIIQENVASFSYIGGFKDSQIDLFINDLKLIGKKEILELNEMRQFAPKVSIPVNHHHSNVFSNLLSIINNKEFNAALKYMDFFEDELKDVAKIISLNKDFKKADDFKFLLTSWVDQVNLSQKYEAKKVLEDDNWFKFFSSYTLMNKLSENLEDNSNIKVNRIKI